MVSTWTPVRRDSSPMVMLSARASVIKRMGKGLAPVATTGSIKQGVGTWKEQAMTTVNAPSALDASAPSDKATGSLSFAKGQGFAAAGSLIGALASLSCCIL